MQPLIIAGHLSFKATYSSLLPHLYIRPHHSPNAAHRPVESPPLLLATALSLLESATPLSDVLPCLPLAGPVLPADSTRPADPVRPADPTRPASPVRPAGRGGGFRGSFPAAVTRHLGRYCHTCCHRGKLFTGGSRCGRVGGQERAETAAEWIEKKGRVTRSGQRWAMWRVRKSRLEIQVYFQSP